LNIKMKKINLGKSIKQMILRHMASYSVLNDSRGLSHLYDIIVILQSVIPESDIRGEFEDYEEMKLIIIKFGKKIYCINHFFSLIKDNDIKNSNLWKASYRNYLRAISDIPVFHQKITRFFSYLISKTTLTDESIPSEYLTQAKQDSIVFKDETNMERKFLEKRRNYFENKIVETEKKEENDN